MIFFLPLLALIIITAVATLLTSEHAEKQARLHKEWHTVNIQASNLDRDIQQITSDLAFLTHRREMLDLWDDQGLPVPDVLSRLTTEYLEVLDHLKLYDQIRLIDEEGMEFIRVNFNSNSPFVVPLEQLQNKKGRYYFNDAIQLGQGDVFVSPLDLNIEHGEIEQPLKPTMRFATPVFDKNGTKRGIVLLNYLAEGMLMRFASQSDTLAGSQAILLNAEGYWLVGPNQEEVWGFMYEDRKEATFRNAYPEAWERIISDESGQFETTHGLFTFITVYPLLEGQKSSTGSGDAFASSISQLEKDQYFWKVISFVPGNILHETRDNRRTIVLFIVMITSVTLFFGVKRIVEDAAIRKEADIQLKEANITLQSQLIDIKELEAALREQAIRDPLTGLFNRRHMDDVLKRELSKASRNEKPLSVVFIDVDNLKEINDSYGHVEGGDKALQIFANVLKQICRTEDIICRYAGDEFLVILHSTSTQSAYKRALEWRKAISGIKIKVDNKEFNIAFSAGIATFPDHCANGKQIIHCADQALYHAKELGRNQVIIYSDTFAQNPISPTLSTTSTSPEISNSDKPNI